MASSRPNLTLFEYGDVFFSDGNDGMRRGACPKRSESSAMSTTSRSLVLMNYFPTNPNTTQACVDNSATGLISMMTTCYAASANRWPNFIAVDYYKAPT